MCKNFLNYFFFDFCFVETSVNIYYSVVLEQGFRTIPNAIEGSPEFILYIGTKMPLNASTVNSHIVEN